MLSPFQLGAVETTWGLEYKVVATYLIPSIFLSSSGHFRKPSLLRDGKKGQCYSNFTLLLAKAQDHGESKAMPVKECKSIRTDFPEIPS